MSHNFTIVAAIVFIAGCAGTEVIDSRQATIGPDSSVVAFSVNTSKLSDFETSVRPTRLEMYYAGEQISIRLSDTRAGLQRVLLDLPADSVAFTQFELATGAGIFSDHFVTGEAQVFELTPGEITYLGRIEIEDIAFNENTDGSVGEPSAVKIVFSDAFEDDHFAWEQQYKLFQDRAPVKQAVGIWSGQDYLVLRPKDWSRSYPSNIYQSSGERREGPPASWVKRPGPN